MRQRPATCLLGYELDTFNLQRPPLPASMLTFLHSLPLLGAVFRALYREPADLKAQVCLRVNPRETWKRDQTQFSETRHTRDPRTVVTVGNPQAQLSPASKEKCTKGALTLYFIAAVVWSDEPWSYPSHSVKHCGARPSIEHRAGWKREPSPPAHCGASELTARPRPVDHGPHLHTSPPLAGAGEDTASTPPTSNF